MTPIRELISLWGQWDVKQIWPNFWSRFWAFYLEGY